MKKTKDLKNLFQSQIFLLWVPVFSYCLAYGYLVGKYSYYCIPSELIEVNQEDFFKALLFTFTTTVLLLLLVQNFHNLLHEIKARHIDKAILSMFTIISLSLFVYLGLKYLILTLLGILILVAVLIIPLIITIITIEKTTEKVIRKKGLKYPENISSKIINFVGRDFYLFSAIATLLYCAAILASFSKSEIAPIIMGEFEDGKYAIIHELNEGYLVAKISDTQITNNITAKSLFDVKSIYVDKKTNFRMQQCKDESVLRDLAR